MKPTIPSPGATTHPAAGINHRVTIAHAWSGMLAVLLMMLLADVVQLAALGSYADFSATLAADPGISGLRALVYLACANVLMQVAIHTFDGKVFRLFVAVATGSYALFFMGHQVVHLAAGEGVGLQTVLDVTHHLLGVWALWAARCWRNSPGA